ncbi:MAG: Phosphoribosyltransferase [Candidatus Amesbacteria bacterium GW2011_GWB1_47_26]|uniref:Phosphoribosyltransferase n=1 Tax=Candidatus Amesbacteria bacterium GW2011_GWC2_45_19 TaxID=1618366 RepID=A0A0G1M374_9BACT|nr:MAG: Phosphoribosyltransferase [Candidatus Amesbacteria bacterium GW2011_GWC2_45_19]KKU69379.1 MAG: Phosphoribosyltransferase [Microgenomates group bacterium GW2011_GWC1_47_20]KKU74531.1 MAG: Phosphoribosyltransferase [Candidatus Amesbacteria bacterium GW2011_GWB1_47_26]
MNLLDILWPKKCVNCGKFGAYVCEDCKVGLWEEEQICPVCTRNSRYGLPHKYCHKSYGLDGLTCLWSYEGIAKKIIKKAKYKYFYDLLGELINLPEGGEYFYLQKFLQEKPVVVPVPLHEKRYRERGFNQAEVIAKSFAARHKLSCNSHLLFRVRDTGHQAGRERDERLKAVQGAFVITPHNSLPTTVLLIDDVWTTGATMCECCRVLKKAGIEKVWGLALAR